MLFHRTSCENDCRSMPYMFHCSPSTNCNIDMFPFHPFVMTLCNLSFVFLVRYISRSSWNLLDMCNLYCVVRGEISNGFDKRQKKKSPIGPYRSSKSLNTNDITRRCLKWQWESMGKIFFLVGSKHLWGKYKTMTHV